MSPTNYLPLPFPRTRKAVMQEQYTGPWLKIELQVPPEEMSDGELLWWAPEVRGLADELERVLKKRHPLPGEIQKEKLPR